MRFVVFVVAIFILTGCQSNSTTSENRKEAQHEFDPHQVLSSLVEKALADLNTITIDSMVIPRTIEDGKLKGTHSKKWTSGFYPGVLWQLYGFSNNVALKEAAESWSEFVEKEKWDDGTHDLGFKIYCPFGNAYKVTKLERYKDVFVTAGKTLSTRYNENVKATRSWDFNKDKWQYPVIIDNMMNLELLFETSNHTGDSKYHRVALNHANTTLENHFRSDNSSYHVIDYNPATGEVVNRHTHQGMNHESAWSRGQAWGLYGFTVAYRYTKNQKFLDQAKRIAEFFYTHENLPDDLIPYWDFDAEGMNQPRDVSASVIAASGLLELQKYVPEKSAQYLSWAEKTLSNLGSEKYKLETAPFFLQHSTGSVPGKFEIDSPIIYAEYYYVEALLRLNEIYNSEKKIESE